MQLNFLRQAVAAFFLAAGAAGITSLSGSAGPALAGGEQVGRPHIILAQSSQERPDYLPPPGRGSDREERRGTGNTDDDPRPISPRRQEEYYTEPGRADSRRGPSYGDPYSPPPSRHSDGPPPRESYNDGPGDANTYSSNEILDAGHRFFGTVSKGLANVIEYAFRKQGRPNGYILGQEAGGAFVAGLRYGEGVMHTKGFGTQKVYWQGPSLGYDFGAEGSKTLILVYNLVSPEQIYARFAGVDGSAYFVGGAGITFQQHDGVTLAPIRSGVGLRLGANVGYLKYTPYPTWNPF
jgi:hypothetical protein